MAVTATTLPVRILRALSLFLPLAALQCFHANYASLLQRCRRAGLSDSRQCRLLRAQNPNSISLAPANANRSTRQPVGVKPGFQTQEETGESAFESLTEASFPGKWKVIFFYPKNLTFICPTEIAEFARLSSDFADRDAVVLGGSTDNEFCKLAWRRDHKNLHRLPIWQLADTKGSLVDGLGVRSPDGVAYRYTFVVDPDNVIQHVYATNLNVGRSPKDTLRVLDALQTDELCACNREIGGETLKVA